MQKENTKNDSHPTHAFQFYIMLHIVSPALHFSHI